MDHTSPRNYTNIQDIKRFHPTGAVFQTVVFRSYDKITVWNFEIMPLPSRRYYISYRYFHFSLKK